MSQTTLRPDATVAQTGILAVGGGSAATIHLSLDDEPANNTTYMENTGSSQASVRLGFPNVTWPSGAVLKSLQVKINARVIGSALYGRVIGDIRKSDGTKVAEFDWNRIGTAFAAYTSPLFAPALTSGELNAAEVFLWINKSQYGGLYPARVSEVYLLAVLAEQPTAVITTATTSYTVSTVGVDWSHTAGGDGGEQSFWQVVYLTAAQAAGITGGDPLTSANQIYDSGIQPGNATSVTVTNVPGGTNHKRYVRTAQLVNGQPHWSAWANQTFTVTLTTSETSSVLPVVDLVNGSIVVTVNRNTGTDPWTGVDVERRPVGGSTWTTVVADAAASGDSVVVNDYLAPPGVAVEYRGRALKAGPVAGSWVQSAGSVTWSPTAAWLKVPGHPSMNLRPWTFDEPPANTQQREFNVTRLLDDGTSRARDVVTYGALGGRVTEFSIWTESLAEAAQLRAIVEHGECVVQPPPSWRFAEGMFALADLVEDVQDVDAGYFYQLWRISAVELLP